MTVLQKDKNILIVGDDFELQKLVKSSLEFVMPGYNIKYCSTLRLGSPDSKLRDLAALILIWKTNPIVDWRMLLEKKVPTHRSSEGIICDISTQIGESLMRRTAIISKSLSREDVTFLAEFGVSCIHPIASKRTEWTKDFKKFAEKVRLLVICEDNDGRSPEEKSVRRFERALKNWKTLTNTEKMNVSDDLLHHLGDTARYCELMSRRAALESDTLIAEKWLRRAIEKNPTFLRAFQALADLLKAQGQVAQALAIYERLQLNSPRNPIRLLRIAECHQLLENLHNSSHNYSRSLSLDEFSLQTREDFARVKLALGDYDSAKMLLSHCGDVSRVASYLNAYGIQLVKAGRYEESIEHYKKAQMVLPTNTNRHQILFNIGLAYAKWGKFSEARQYAQLALARDPSYTKAAQLLRTVEDRLP